MPATKLNTGNFIRNQQRSTTTDIQNNVQERQQVYDTFESNPNRNSITRKKINVIKSFWSSNLSLASTSSSTSSQQQNSNNKSNIISSSKKLFRDLITRSPSPSMQRQAQPVKLQRSHTMRPNERRRFFNRSSTRNSNINDQSLQLNQTIATDFVEPSTSRQQTNKPNHLYDKLFINKKLNAANTQLVKQIDDELSPYSHIYKDFTVDCLKPFFKIEKIEKIQFDPITCGDIENLTNEQTNEFNEANSSAVHETKTTPESNAQIPIDQKNNEMVNDFEESSDNSPSTSLCLSSSSSNSFGMKTEEVNASCEVNQQAPTHGIPVPQPRSIYLTYETYRQNQRLLLEKTKNEQSGESTEHQARKDQVSTFRSHGDLIIPSSSSCSSSNSSSPTKFTAQFNEINAPSNNLQTELIYGAKSQNSAFTVVTSNTNHNDQSPINVSKPARPIQQTRSETLSSTTPSTSSRTESSSISSCALSNNETDSINTNRSCKKNILNGQDYEDIRDDDIEKRRIAKGRVIDELIQTEMDYYKVMKLLYDVYLGASSEDTIEQSQKETIFCNLQEIMNLSSIMLNDFETYILNKSFETVNIGKCFLKNADEIKKTYSYFTQYIEYSNNILEKNEKVVEVQQFIQNGLNIIKQQTTSAFDLHSLLLKPIQRVLKYPLLLQELIKNTEVYHEDYKNLNQALASMQHVAMYINEIKRRRELIVKYGRQNKDQSTITDKMSKFTIHSVIKKSNRISMKLSNVFGLGITTVDEEFDKLETRFHYYEKLIKSFNKDSLQHLSNLKEFFKIQTVTSESIQEYYGEYESDEIQQYVRINATVLNEIYNKNLNFVHEKVLQPLNSLLKLLEVPNKLITKRHDKLLDFECARANYEKNKEKNNLIKVVQENLYECQKNYEALNNQLIEDLPNLIEKCSYIFAKCFKLYMSALKNIHEKVQYQLRNLINPTTLSSHVRADSVEVDPRQPNDVMKKRMTMTVESIRKKFLVVKMLRNLAQNDESNSSIPKSAQPPKPSTVRTLKQTDQVKSTLKKTYRRESLFKATENFTGHGIQGDIVLEINDIVGVIKKADPCGNPLKWFVDNGCVKGIVAAEILEPFFDAQMNLVAPKAIEEPLNVADYSSLEDFKRHENHMDQSDNLSNKESIGSFDENSNRSHEYVNSTSTKKSEYCRVMYTFESIDETTMTVHEGENLKILQKHDDNMNDEWWLLEKILVAGQQIAQNSMIRGYVPSNYVQLINRMEVKSPQQPADHVVLLNE